MRRATRVKRAPAATLERLEIEEHIFALDDTWENQTAEVKLEKTSRGYFLRYTNVYEMEYGDETVSYLEEIIRTPCCRRIQVTTNIEAPQFCGECGKEFAA